MTVLGKHFYTLCLGSLATLVMLGGCTSVTIDHYQTSEIDTQSGDAVVVLGRRTASNYDTELDLIACVGDSLAGGASDIQVIPEDLFVDRLYPWFEPRTAPVRVAALQQLVKEDLIAGVLDEYNIRHIVWIDGKTETTDSSGSIGCSIGAGGMGCFGFGTWDQESRYEASIWDLEEQKLVGQISTDAFGTSYMPALIVPIPIIARVQASACDGMAKQLDNFFSPGETAATVLK